MVGQTVTQAENDKQQMEPLLETIRRQSGQKPKEVLADSGYCSEKNLQHLAKQRIGGFVATGKQKHGYPLEPCPRGPLPKGTTRVELQRKLATQMGAAVYATRKKSSSRCLDRSNRYAVSGSFFYVGCRKCKANGP